MGKSRKEGVVIAGGRIFMMGELAESTLAFECVQGCNAADSVSGSGANPGSAAVGDSWSLGASCATGDCSKTDGRGW